MDKGEFLLEIGCEDLPEWTAAFLEQLPPLLGKELEKNRVSYGQLELFISPRRIVILCHEMALQQEEIQQEVTGPPVSVAFDSSGCPTEVARGFAAAHGVKVEELCSREKKGRKVLVAIKHLPGKPTASVIIDVIRGCLEKLEIPRAMGWNDKPVRFIRPVRWVVLLLNGRVVRGELLGVRTGRKSYGHRVLAPESFSVSSIQDYLQKLDQFSVVLDWKKRQEMITVALSQQISPDSYFDTVAVERVCRLVEYPVVTVGKVSEQFQHLAVEVIEAVINKLKGIPVYEKGACVHFGIVLDGVGNWQIKENYQKVLSDRLQDACFFLSQDAKKSLLQYSQDLERIVYHPRWGSVLDRVKRFLAIAGAVTEQIHLGKMEEENLLTAIKLCKNDLATQMVTEFPALQGVIGRIYARKEGYPEEIALAIEQHYWPKGPGDKIPETLTGAVISVIDRLETLCCFFLEAEEVSGAGDPFGLKRTANGMIEIIWKKRLSFSLSRLVESALKSFQVGPGESVKEKIVGFIIQRVDSLLSAEGISAGIRRAVLAVEKENMLVLREKIEALREFLSSGEGEAILVGFTRVANILQQARKKGLVAGLVQEDRLVEEAEQNLFRIWQKESGELKKIYSHGDYRGFLDTLKKWRQPIDTFFDEVLVMCPRESLRENRLGLLKAINDVFLLMADFSHIAVEDLKGNVEKN